MAKLDQKTLLDLVIEPLLAKYPEIKWFADPGVFTTPEMPTAVSPTPSWTQQLASKQLIPASNKKYVELERMLQSVVCLHLLQLGTDEAYRYWIQAQNEAPLTRESFQTLHEMLKTLLKTESEVYTALEASLVYSDLGKTPTAKRLAKAVNISNPDHDDFMEAIYTASSATRVKIIPSFEILNPAVQAHVLALHKAVPLHWGHALHLEGGALMFARLLKSNPKPQHVQLAFLIQVCDVAASAAHTNPNGAVAFNQLTFMGYQSVLATVNLLLTERNTSSAFKKLIEDRRGWVNYPKQDTPETRVLSRICAFIRFFTPEQGLALQTAATNIWNVKEDRELLTSVFDIERGINTWTRNPTYINGALLNLLNIEPTKPLVERCERVLQGALAEARICRQYESLGHHTSDTPLCFQQFAEQAKSNPSWFLKATFRIEDMDFTKPQLPIINDFFINNVNIEALREALAITALPVDPILKTIMTFYFHPNQIPKMVIDTAEPEKTKPPIPETSQVVAKLQG